MAPRGSITAVGAAFLTASGTAGADEVRVDGLVAARGISVESRPPWLEGGFGRLTEGGERPGDTVGAFRGHLQLGLDWKPSEVWTVHAQGVVRYEPSEAGGERVGLMEGFLQYRPELTPSRALRLRAGLFFPPTSRENTERLWQSPYTITLSALNTWIGEEARLTGVDAALQGKSGDDEWELAGAAFLANDTSGALVAWRGWSFGDRLTSVGETLPLPPLATFGPGGAFGDQQAGTRPLDELDGRLGWQARGRWSRPSAVLLQAAWIDNGGDRRLYHGQYSWKTRFGQVGLDLHLGKTLTVVGEVAIGDTGMGPEVPGGPHVDVRFEVGYLLASWHEGRWRVTARYDRFRNEDKDGTAEPDGEAGWAWTAAAFWEPSKHVRVGVEYLDVHGARPAAAYSEADGDADARRLLLEFRVRVP
jgi:hypothetical protein